MSTWGHKPLENDAAADLATRFNEAKNIALLEQSFDAVNSLNASQYLEAPIAEEAIAAAQITQNLSANEVKSEDRSRLLDKSNNALKRILENSELKDLWSESEKYKEWISVVESLLHISA